MMNAQHLISRLAAALAPQPSEEGDCLGAASRRRGSARLTAAAAVPRPRHTWRLLGGLLAMGLGASCLAAPGVDGYPIRPSTVVVPYPPGGSTHMATRIIAAELSKNVGQPVLVENRAGGGGIVGVGSVARSDPDGYTLVVGVS